ncbi:unnamed protein product, partial [Pylaiella littoralis]
SSTGESETESGGVGSDGNLTSTAIRTLAGAGEPQSRAQVQKQQAEVKSKAPNEAFRQKRLARGDQITKAVKTLADSVAARRVLDKEAAVRARETAAEFRKQRKVNNMRGQLEFSEVGSAQYYELR